MFKKLLFIFTVISTFRIFSSEESKENKEIKEKPYVILRNQCPNKLLGIIPNFSNPKTGKDAFFDEKITFIKPIYISYNKPDFNFHLKALPNQYKDNKTYIFRGYSLITVGKKWFVKLSSIFINGHYYGAGSNKESIPIAKKLLVLKNINNRPYLKINRVFSDDFPNKDDIYELY